MKFELFEDGKPCVDNCVCSFVDVIFKAYKISVHNEGRYPDNIMIHHTHKGSIYREVEDEVAYNVERGKATNIFNMLIIWTDNIPENEIICTYNAR